MSAGALVVGFADEASKADPSLVAACVQAGVHPTGSAAALAAVMSAKPIALT